jgi:sRNA-binding protein
MTRKQKRAAQNAALIALLAETFPACFVVQETKRRPIKVGIFDDIVAKLGGAIQSDELHHALRSYVGSVGYLRSFRQVDAARVDLDGNIIATVTTDEIEFARVKLVARLKKRDARQPSVLLTVEPPAKPAPPPAEKRVLSSLADLRAAAARRKAGASV